MTRDANVNQALRMLRMLLAAIGGGMVIFAGIAVLLVKSGSVEPKRELVPILLAVLGLVTVTQIPVYTVIRRGIVSKARQAWERGPSTDDPTPELLPQFNTLTIIAGALAEGFGLFGTVVFLLTASWPALVAPALALVALTAVFPSRDRLNRFVTTVTGQYR